ncbi:unnamed protein product, partial [Meganyctiphanes norvegica]
DGVLLEGNVTWLEAQVTRVGRVNKVCSELNISQPMDEKLFKHILVDEKHQALYCVVPKAACTSWKRLWFWLAGVLEPDEDIMELSRNIVHGPMLPHLSDYKYTEEKQQEMLKTYKKFLFTRHPLERLISAYRDKLQSVDSESNFDFHTRVGQEVERFTRGRVTGGGHNVTFQEFVRWATPPNGTWTQAQLNEHWMPMVDICAPCAIKYNAIGRYEDLKNEVNATLIWLGAGELADRFPLADRPFHAEKLHKLYFDQLNTENKMRFLRTYMLDFLIFGYDFV